MRPFKTLALSLAVLACGALPASALGAAAEQATLSASFSPNRLGTPTTISFGFHLSDSEGRAPASLTGMDLRMPAGMNYTTTTLGLAICHASVLVEKGLSACPPNSRLGYGSAVVEVPFGTGAGHEVPEIQALAGPSPHGNLVVLFYANGQSPVYAQIAFSGEVLPASGAFGSQLTSVIPLIASVPGGPNVSIVSVHTTIGPSHLTYYRRVHGRRVAFTPRGVSVPEHCPRGGFPFQASFTFQDGGRAQAETRVPCPPARHH
jgi:hypothetical protein